MKHIYFAVVFLIFVAVFSSCSEEAQINKTADEFYKHLKADEYDEALKLIDSSAFETYTREDFIEWMKGRNKYWGKIKSYKRFASEINETDSFTSASYSYIVFSERDTVYEILEFISRGDEYRILTYGFSAEKEDVIPQKETE